MSARGVCASRAQTKLRGATPSNLSRKQAGEAFFRSYFFSSFFGSNERAAEFMQ
jgi:hypothetical protein